MMTSWFSLLRNPYIRKVLWSAAVWIATHPEEIARMVREWRKLVEEVFSSKTDEPPSDAPSREAAADVQRQGAAII